MIFMERSLERSWVVGVWLVILSIFAIAAAAKPAVVLSSNVHACPERSNGVMIAASKEKAQVKVLVPNISSLRQFVNCSDPARVRGFCIDVFERALSILPVTSSTSPNMSIHYSCFNFSRSPGGPTYDTMVDQVAKGTYDAVVGDVTIGAYRSSVVDFTHHYMESGMVILGTVARENSHPWLLFAWPFSLRMWCTIIGAFCFVGLILCSLEIKNLPNFSEGSIGERAHTISWFVVEALIFLEKDKVESTISRLVVVAWVFFLLLLSASYTAGLSSFLTASTILPSTLDVISLKESGKPIGYRRGSIVEDLLEKRFQIPTERLVPLRTDSEFVGNITKGPTLGGVLAIVDELPYANILLANLSSSSNCDFSILGPQITHQGFGFGFNKERNLSTAFSIAILSLTESGYLQKLQNSYGMGGSTNSSCYTSGNYSNQVTWKSSLALFGIIYGALLICISISFVTKYVCPRPLRTLHQRPQVLDDSANYILDNMVHRRHRPQGEVELRGYTN